MFGIKKITTTTFLLTISLPFAFRNSDEWKNLRIENRNSKKNRINIFHIQECTNGKITKLLLIKSIKRRKKKKRNVEMEDRGIVKPEQIC